MTDAARIRLLVLDVDGVLTDGRLYYGPDGEVMKSFFTRDGYGLKRVMRAGIHVAVISGRPSAATATRLAELGVERVVLDCDDKRPVLEGMQRDLGVDRTATAVVGDDTLDLGMMACAALKIAVADAHHEVKAAADWVTTLPGGRGAVREVCDALLDASRSEAR